MAATGDRAKGKDEELCPIGLPPYGDLDSLFDWDSKIDGRRYSGNVVQPVLSPGAVRRFTERDFSGV
jgi:hypothetical protein